VPLKRQDLARAHRAERTQDELGNVPGVGFTLIAAILDHLPERDLVHSPNLSSYHHRAKPPF